VKTGVIAFPLDRPVQGGIDRYVHRLAREFHWGPATSDFVWIHGTPFSVGAPLAGAPEAILPEHGLGGTLARRRWARANREKLDVLFGPYFGVLPGPFAKVMTVHDLYAFTARDAGFLWTARFRAATRRMAAMSDYIIADSEASRRQVVELLDTPSDRAVAIHLGVDPVALPSLEARSAARRELRAQFGWPTQTRVVLFVGALIPRKDPLTLLRAFAALHNGRPDTRLLFLGAHTRASPRVADEAARLGIASAVAAPGAADEATLARAYAGADLFALPSAWEGFGLPAVEAMAHGLPVVLSKGGALPEVGGDAALYFAAGDGPALREQLERLLASEAECARLARLGRSRAAHFTWARCAEETLAVLAKAAKR